MKPEEQKIDIKRKRICLCIPVCHVIPAAFLPNLIKIITHNMFKYIIDVKIQETNPVDMSRNTLVESALNNDPDYIMFLDTDNLCAPETVGRFIEIIEEKKADFVTALYFEKLKPYFPVLREYRSGGYWKVEKLELGKLIEIKE